MEKAAVLLLFLLAVRATCLRGPIKVPSFFSKCFGCGGGPNKDSSQTVSQPAQAHEISKEKSDNDRSQTVQSQPAQAHMISNDKSDNERSQTVQSQPAEAHEIIKAKLSNDEIVEAFIQADAFAETVTETYSPNSRWIAMNMKKRTIGEIVVLGVIKEEHRDNVKKLLENGPAELVADYFKDGRKPIKRTLLPPSSTAPLPPGSTPRVPFVSGYETMRDNNPDNPVRISSYTKYADADPKKPSVNLELWLVRNSFTWTLKDGKWGRFDPKKDGWTFLTKALEDASPTLTNAVKDAKYLPIS